MAKTKSYLDWELSFKKKGKSARNSNKKKKENSEEINSFGLCNKVLREYLKNWKHKNLP